MATVTAKIVKETQSALGVWGKRKKKHEEGKKKQETKKQKALIDPKAAKLKKLGRRSFSCQKKKKEGGKGPLSSKSKEHF